MAISFFFTCNFYCNFYQVFCKVQKFDLINIL